MFSVIVDLPKNPKANTGNFELVYKQKVTKLPNVDTTKLVLQGTPLTTEYFCNKEDLPEPKPSHEISKEIMKITDAHKQITQVSSEMKKALKNLLNIIAKERKRRADLRAQKKQTNEQINVESVESSINEKEKHKLEVKSAETDLNQGDTNKDNQGDNNKDNRGDNKDTAKSLEEIYSAKLKESITSQETKMIENILVNELNEPQVVEDVVVLLQNEIESQRTDQNM